MSYGREKSFIFSHIARNDCRVLLVSAKTQKDIKSMSAMPINRRCQKDIKSMSAMPINRRCGCFFENQAPSVKE